MPYPNFSGDVDAPMTATPCGVKKGVMEPVISF